MCSARQGGTGGHGLQNMLVSRCCPLRRNDPTQEGERGGDDMDYDGEGAGVIGRAAGLDPSAQREIDIFFTTRQREIGR